MYVLTPDILQKLVWLVLVERTLSKDSPSVQHTVVLILMYLDMGYLTVSMEFCCLMLLAFHWGL